MLVSLRKCVAFLLFAFLGLGGVILCVYVFNRVSYNRDQAELDVEVHNENKARFDELVRKANNGDVAAMSDVAFYYDRGLDWMGVVSQDLSLAAQWYQKAAEGGDKTAQCIIGRRFLEGKGVQKNEQLGKQWIWKSAMQGDSGAQHFMAQLCLNGDGVPQDILSAFVWASLACNQGPFLLDDICSLKNRIAGMLSLDQTIEGRRRIDAFVPTPQR